MFVHQGIILAILPLLLSAAPLDNRQRSIALPLTQRRGLSGSRTHGLRFDTVGVRGLEDSHVPGDHDGGHAHLSKRVATSVVTLKSMVGDAYEATISIRGKKFKVTPDTGSSDLLLPGPECALARSYGRKQYKPGSSQSPLQTFTIADNTPYPSKGHVHTAAVEIGQLTAWNQAIALADEINPWLYRTHSHTDGLLGLGLPGGTETQALPLLQTLVKERQISTPIFSLLIRSNPLCHSEITFGAPNDNLRQNSISYAPVLQNDIWSVRMNMSISNPPIELSVDAYLHSTIADIKGDPESVAEFYAAVSPDARKLEPGGNILAGQWGFPCETDVPITMSFGGQMQRFSLARDNFAIWISRGLCIGTVVDDPNLPEDTWQLGLPFFKGFYVVFDASRETPRVGFADVSDAVTNEVCVQNMEPATNDVTMYSDNSESGSGSDLDSDLEFESDSESD